MRSADRRTKTRGTYCNRVRALCVGVIVLLGVLAQPAPAQSTDADAFAATIAQLDSRIAANIAAHAPQPFLHGQEEMALFDAVTDHAAISALPDDTLKLAEVCRGLNHIIHYYGAYIGFGAGQAERYAEVESWSMRIVVAQLWCTSRMRETAIRHVQALPPVDHSESRRQGAIMMADAMRLQIIPILSMVQKAGTSAASRKLGIDSLLAYADLAAAASLPADRTAFRKLLADQFSTGPADMLGAVAKISSAFERTDCTGLCAFVAEGQ